MGGLLLPGFALVLILSLGNTVALSSNSWNKASNTSLGGGLDCNGYSSISPNVQEFNVCADVFGEYGGRAYDNGHYIGHDEPQVEFFSDTSGSANNLEWQLRLPRADPVPTKSGSSVANFELYPTFWLSLALCDPFSFPQNPCTPSSDLNTGTPNVSTDAGSAALELQFYPPAIYPNGLGSSFTCSTTQWCAAMNIFSLECTFHFSFCNPNCDEPSNFAFIQSDGIPTGPPGPGLQTTATYTPNSNTLKMNPGDNLKVIIKDTSKGLMITIKDSSSHQSGFMASSVANGFRHTNINDCSTSGFAFRPEYKTAKVTNIVPWNVVNVALAFEIGHFELGTNGDSDSDDSPCFTTSTISGCLAATGDTDFDGRSYVKDWPDGTSNHPKTLVIGAPNGNGVGPMSFKAGSGYANPYGNIQFLTAVVLSEPGCDTSTGSGCTLPPAGASFYPFFTKSGNGASCKFNFGNDIAGSTSNDFGGIAGYGSLKMRYPGGSYDFFASGLFNNPCLP